MKRNPLELAILTVSLATVIALIAYLSNDALFGTGSAASFQVDVGTGATANGGDGWLVSLRVRNSGGQAALDVTLVGNASVDGVDEVSQIPSTCWRPRAPPNWCSDSVLARTVR